MTLVRGQVQVYTGNGKGKTTAALDLVTEMVEVKHYFRSGVMARVGIEK
jgi:ATP:corrinoid adenosyltransferase